MLSQANRAFRSDTRMEQAAPRNSGKFIVVPPSGGWVHISKNQFTTNVGFYMYTIMVIHTRYAVVDPAGNVAAGTGSSGTGVTRCVSKRDVSSNESPIRLRQHGTLFFFFTNMLHNVQHVCEKAWNLPPCRRRYPPSKPGIVCCMPALAVSRFSLISWCSWSKLPPRKSSQ